MRGQRQRDGERQGFPEETRTSGHDAQPAPVSAAKDVGVRRAAAQLNSASTPSQTTGDVSQGAADAAFLVKGFGIPPGKASKLVDGDSPAASNATEAEARRLLADDDPLAGLPTPEEPAADLTVDSDEERLKPVVHQPTRSANSLK